MAVDLDVVVNGVQRRLSVDAGEPLLATLRDRLGLIGTKEGCNEGECGACTVLVDGQPVDSCLFAAAAAHGREVRTVESLGGPGELAPLQRAFVDHHAVQCGFCTPGFLMTLTALLEQRANPSPDEVREALAGNLCRCTGYAAIVDAVASAAQGST